MAFHEERTGAPHNLFQPTVRQRTSRFCQFSTRSLLVMVTVCSIAVCVVAAVRNRPQRREALVARYQANGANVTLASWADDIIELSTWSPWQLGPKRIIEEAPHLRDLSILSSCNDALLEQLSQLTHLEVLYIRDHTKKHHHANITDEGLAHIARLSTLKTLRLTKCQTITDAGMAHLATLENLEILELPFSSIGDEGVAHIAKLPRLKRLVMNQTPMTDKSLTYLRSSPTLAQLWVGPAVTDGAMESFRRATSVVITRFPRIPPRESTNNPTRLPQAERTYTDISHRNGDRGSR